MIIRNLRSELQQAATWAPSITLTGPRQSGKTTLCRSTFPNHPYRSLEEPDQRSFAQEDPRGFLAQFPRGALLDEVQRVPDLLSYLQSTIDEAPVAGRWILTGSQNLALLESVSQSLAGRTAMHQLLPLSWDEIRRFPEPPADLEEAIFKGGYPRIFDRQLDPSAWLSSYVATYVERDVRRITRVGDLSAFQRFVELCAGRTAQLLKYSGLASDCGISQPTAKAWFSILEAGFIAFHLPAFHAKFRRRLVKMPRLYFYDTGLACWLLGIREPGQLRTHPLRGALFETWVVSEVLKHRTHSSQAGGLSFYRDSNGVEVDLVVDDRDAVTLIEAKSAATPRSRLLNYARRVRTVLSGVRPRPEVVLVYGGIDFQRRSDARIVPWRSVRTATPPQVSWTVEIFAGSGPVSGADVSAILPDGRRVASVTGLDGRADLDLPDGHHPLTVLIAKDGFAGHAEMDWVPDECALHVHLARKVAGGSRIAQTSRPGMQVEVRVKGQLIRVEAAEGETAAAELNNGEQALGKTLALRVKKVVGDIALLEYSTA